MDFLAIPTESTAIRLLSSFGQYSASEQGNNHVQVTPNHARLSHALLGKKYARAERS
jgi:hypothetical protein